MISPQWNLEAGLSLGYAHLNYKRYGQPEGAAFIEKSHCNYWGPTQIGIHSCISFSKSIKSQHNMKTKAFIFFSLLICNLLPAQNVKLDIVPHFFGVRADSLFLSMDISVHIKDMDSKSAFILTPVLTSQEKRVSLPHIQLNGKQKQKLYLRNQILRKKNDRKEEDAKAYLIAGIDEDHSRTISYRTSLPTEDWMNNATLILKRTIVRPEGEQSLKDTIVITPQNIAASSGANSSLPVRLHKRSFLFLLSMNALRVRQSAAK